ncbi:hypothetical protein RHMOL_Rhmol05G0126700 [Rhododendron molle]|uniref:Uncharacterized protein n=1 Tax=Rhododendron molle TaxID=49168 RepID=A0ACC0NN61_RHOML|nr:hypothetical protein RHMOL_Rhmol05G0126700 [Rhododendron molle]
MTWVPPPTPFTGNSHQPHSPPPSTTSSSKNLLGPAMTPPPPLPTTKGDIHLSVDDWIDWNFDIHLSVIFLSVNVNEFVTCPFVILQFTGAASLLLMHQMRLCSIGSR